MMLIPGKMTHRSAMVRGLALLGLVAMAACAVNLDQRLYGEGRADVEQTWIVSETTVNYWRPGNTSERGGSIPPGVLTQAVLLVNNSSPGPDINALVGQLVRIRVISRLTAAELTIHWHGILQRGSPWADGVEGVSQCAIAPNGGEYTYSFLVDEPGTYFWHAHIANLMDYGLVGSLTVRYPPGADPSASLYDDDARSIVVHDWWRDPVGMLKAPGFRNFQDQESATINGYFAPLSAAAAAGLPAAPGSPTPTDPTAAAALAAGSTAAALTAAPWAPVSTLLPPIVVDNDTVANAAKGADGRGGWTPYIINVTAGRCTRLRIINANAESVGWQVSVGGHNLTIIELDAHGVQPWTVTSFALYGGNRVDSVLCADALGPAPTITAPVDFPLVFSSVSQVATTLCPWFPNRCQYRVAAIVRYLPTASAPAGPTNTSAAVTAAAAPRGFNATYVADPQRDPRAFVPRGVRPVVPGATRQIRLQVGFAARLTPPSSGTVAFMAQPAPVRQPFEMPSFPALLSKLTCGLEDNTIFERVTNSSETVEFVVENLTDMPHPIHIHGHVWAVLGNSFTREAQWQGDLDDPGACPPGQTPTHADKGWLTLLNNTGGYRRFWGCAFGNSDAERQAFLGYKPLANITTNAAAGGGLGQPAEVAYISDTFVVPPRSWAVARVGRGADEWNTGVWPIHCHTIHHFMRGMGLLLDVLPATRPPLPDWLSPAWGSAGVGVNSSIHVAGGACGYGCPPDIAGRLGQLPFTTALLLDGAAGFPPPPVLAGSSSDGGRDGGLSTGASIGLGLGVGLPLLLIIAALIAWTWTHRSGVSGGDRAAGNSSGAGNSHSHGAAVDAAAVKPAGPSGAAAV